MKRLEDIPRKNIFEVPDGYFDRLPNAIQERIAEQKVSRWSFVFSNSWKFALPAVAAVVVVFFVWFKNDPSIVKPEEMLASISSEELVAYLHGSDISLEELLELSGLEEVHPDSLHLHVISNFTESEMEVNELEKELENEI